LKNRDDNPINLINIHDGSSCFPDKTL
jgi:hypothetical protein